MESMKGGPGKSNVAGMFSSNTAATGGANIASMTHHHSVMHQSMNFNMGSGLVPNMNNSAIMHQEFSMNETHLSMNGSFVYFLMFLRTRKSSCVFYPFINYAYTFFIIPIHFSNAPV